MKTHRKQKLSFSFLFLFFINLNKIKIKQDKIYERNYNKTKQIDNKHK